jgi:Xaa-Pro dipeptidase
LAAGDIVILETQGVNKGFWMDINRTAVIGAPTPAYAALHETLREVYLEVIAPLKPGVSTGIIPGRAIELLAARGVSAPDKLLAVGHCVGHMPLEIPVPYPAQGAAGSLGFDLEEGMILSVDCLYFGAEHGPCHMENVFEVTADGLVSMYTTPLELLGPRVLLAA